MPHPDYEERVLEATPEEARQLMKHAESKDRELKRGALQTAGYATLGTGLGVLSEAPPVAEQAVADVVGSQRAAVAERAATTGARARAGATTALNQAAAAFEQAALEQVPSPGREPTVTQPWKRAGEALRTATKAERTAGRAAAQASEEAAVAQRAGMRGGGGGAIAAMTAGMAPSLMFLGEYERGQDFGNQLRYMSLRALDRPLETGDLNPESKAALTSSPELLAQLFSEGVLSHALMRELSGGGGSV